MAVPQLRLVKTLWGVDEAEDPDKWDDLFSRIKREGFDGVESNRFIWNLDKTKWVELLRKHELIFVAQVHTSSRITDGREYEYRTSCEVADHIASFATLTAEAAELGAKFINVHSGHDLWCSGPKAIEYLTAVLEIGSKLPCPVVHETHRRRVMWNPYSAGELLAHPALKGKLRINADLSHWVCACEHVFEDDTELDKWWPPLLAAVAEHCDFIHARVGHPNGPQVAHPDDPHHATELAAHMKWWKTIWRAQLARGMKEVWCEPEFGPAPYMTTLPWTGVPVANLWAVNNRMAELCREEFSKLVSL
mmetsp:Transcript_9928/g.22569  ORF Transcript_9928/g.22569 Transcript_9928/m.22569 type:complete len:306 (-) Transcript_9928:192-1109(-)